MLQRRGQKGFMREHRKKLERGGFVRQVLIMLTLAVVFTISGCSGSGGKELFETAKFEELQNNPQHATELYEEIVKKYPKSEYAKKAEERLNVLKGNK